MTAKKSATATVPTTTTAPAKPKRTRKAVLNSVPPGTEEAALAKLHSRNVVGEAAVLSKPLDPADFAFDEEIVRPIPPGDPMDLSADTVHVPPGFSFMEAQQEQMLAKGNFKIAELQAEITDLTGKLRDADAARERDVASLRQDLDEADRVKAHAENVTEAALAKAVEDGKTTAALQTKVAGLEATLSIKSKANTAHQSANAALRRQIGDDAARIAELELQLACARARPGFLTRLRALFSAPSEGRA